jgi:hypothetical protein
MRRSIVLLCVLMLMLSACSSDSTTGNHFFDLYTTDFPEYEYKGETKAEFIDRLFLLEDLPENVAEELAINFYYFDFTGEHERLAAITGENESLKISIKNQEKYFNEGIFTDQKNVIHEVSIVTVEDFLHTTDYFLDDLVDSVKEFGLTAYSVVKVDLTWEYTESFLAMGPQLDSGRYDRLFLVGKNSEADDWKIYEVYWGEYVLE